jgi:diguanylate cyclase (GGDEF)-like protein/PAS domain S-box-containing protein
MAKVLVVDDNSANRELAVTLLRYRGHETLEAEDGAQALALLRSRTAELVISDILMPTMDGYGLVQALRADTALADTRVIFCTAFYREREAQRLAQSCGVREILVKPFEAEELLRAVERALASAPVRAPVHGAPVPGAPMPQQTRALQASLARLSALHELTLRLSSERDPQVVLADVCRGARDLIGARYAVIAVRDRFDPKARSFAVSGIAAATAAALQCPSLERGLCGAAMSDRRARRGVNPSGDPVAVGLPPSYPPLHAVLVAPLVSLTHAYGWICLADKLGETHFDDEDERALGVLAAQVARIYENDSLYAEVQRHAQALQAQLAECHRTMAEQHESAQQFRQLAENIQDVFWITTADYRKVLYLSPAYEHIWGRPREAVFSNPVTWARAVHPDDRAMVHGELMGRAGDGTPFSMQYRIQRPDGTLRWISDHAFPIRDAEGRTYRVAGVARDITDRREQEEAGKRLTRLYAVLSGVNSMIVRVRNRNALFQEVCRIAVTEGEIAYAWIGVIDAITRDGEVVAWYGGSGELLAGLQLTARAEASGSDRPGSIAARTGRAVVINDVASEPSVSKLRAQLLQLKYLSVATVPIMSGKQAVAVMGFGANRTHFFDSAVMALLHDLAGDVAFGLDFIAREGQLAYLALYDVLTGLPNQTLFLERLGQLLRISSGASGIVAVLLLDLDRFTQINDTLGRHVGDALLRRVADRLGAALPGAACVGRAGADSFAIALAELPSGSDAVARLLEPLQHAFGEPLLIDEHQIAASFHAGIALGADDGDEAATLFRNAEAALRRAKAANETWLFYSPAGDAAER